MDSLPGPSLLDYAGFHGIATPYGITCPLDYFDTVQARGDDASTNHDQLFGFENHLSTIEPELHAERLNVSKRDARFLSAVARDTRGNNVDINWDTYLPSMRRLESLKVETPALMTHHGTDLAMLKKHTFFNRRDVVSSLPRRSLPYPIEGSSHRLREAGPEIVETLKSERLNCSRDSLVLIQNAVRCGDIRPSDRSLFFKTLLRPWQKRLYELEPPIEPLNINQLYSSPPAPKPQMLPSPISPEAVEQNGIRDKMSTLDSMASQSLSSDYTRLSRILDSFELGNDQPSIMPPEEASKLSNDRYRPSSSRSPDMICVSTEPHHEGQDIVGSRRPHNNDIEHDHPEVRENMHSNVACSPELVSGRRWESPPIQPTLPCVSQEGQKNKEIHQAPSRPVSPRSYPHNRDKPGLEAPSEVSMDIRVIDDEHMQGRKDNNLISARPKNETPHTTTACCEDTSVFPGQINPFEKTPACGDAPDLLVERCSVDSSSHEIPKRKNKRRDSSSRKHQRRLNYGETIALSQAVQVKSTLSSPFAELGSLSAFMETRGKSSKRRINAKSPYFADESNQANSVPVEHQRPMVNVTDVCLEPDKNGQEVDIAPNMIAEYVPEYPKNSPEPALLFLSTSLLKSHLRLVRILESRKDPTPMLIYRDYGNHTQGHQNEADIIVSPLSAILLTTSQATTQLYLPGHKPSHPQLDGIKGVNSPLRERIVLLAPRYDRLYILVCHTGGSTTGKPGPTADKRTLESMVSLTAFCSSLSGCSAVNPLLITPSTPETVAEWALSLAHKHSLQLPAGRLSVGKSIIGSISSGNSKTRLDPAFMETETQWEVFLRRAGLNPFAAHAILAVLKGEENDSNSMDASGLSRFIEMPAENRRRLFAGLVGEKVIDRVEAVIEQDWQCDWALNSDAIN